MGISSAEPSSESPQSPQSRDGSHDAMDESPNTVYDHNGLQPYFSGGLMPPHGAEVMSRRQYVAEAVPDPTQSVADERQERQRHT